MMDKFAIDLDSALNELEQQELENEQNILQSKSVEKGPQEILPKAINTNKTVEKSASLVKETDELDAELLDIINSCIVENPALLQMTDKNSAISYIAKINDDKPNDSAKPLADNVENNQFKSDFICTTENPSAIESQDYLIAEILETESNDTQGNLLISMAKVIDCEKSIVPSALGTEQFENKEFKDGLNRKEESNYFDTFESPRIDLDTNKKSNDATKSMEFNSVTYREDFTTDTEVTSIQNDNNVGVSIIEERISDTTNEYEQTENGQTLIDIEAVGYNTDLPSTEEFNQELERELEALDQNAGESNIEDSSENKPATDIAQAPAYEDITNGVVEVEATEVDNQGTGELALVECSTDSQTTAESEQNINVEQNNDEVTREQNSVEVESNEPRTSSETAQRDLHIVPNKIEVIDFETEWNQISDNEKMLGLIAPTWLDDTETDSCMKCSAGFTFRKRRHHCRACGLIFCSSCCFIKVALPYNLSKGTVENTDVESGSMSRVCNVCNDTIKMVELLRSNIQKMPKSTKEIVSVLKKKQAPEQATSTDEVNNADNSNQTNENADENSEQPEGKMTRSRSVRFYDGSVPGDEVPAAEATNPTCEEASTSTNTTEERPRSKIKSSKKNRHKIHKHMIRQNRFIEEEIINRVKMNFIVNNLLPPVMNKEENNPCVEADLILKASSDPSGLTFVLLKNLQVHVRIIDLTCCIGAKCWVFASQGLCANGQNEIVYVLKCLIDPDTKELIENTIPRQIFYHLLDIYQKSLRAYRLTSMSHLLYDFDCTKGLLSEDEATAFQSILLGNENNIGFLYYQPTRFNFQCCLQQLKEFLPRESFLIGSLIHKSEMPWVKLFPLRLYLRLGEKFNTYPCALVNDRHRKSVFGEIGNTIMGLLCDVRNFHYTIPQIDGIRIQVEETSVKILIPECQYELIIKSLLTSNEYVLSIAQLQVDETCSSYMTAIENSNLGTYTNKKVTSRIEQNSNTGAAFIVFNGALKPNLTMNAKYSIIEDGVMIQLEPETLGKLKEALQNRKPYTIECNKQPPKPGCENSTVSIEWIKDDSHINRNVLSVIDGRSLCGIKSICLTSVNDYVNDTKSIRWTEIFLILTKEEGSQGAEETPNADFNFNTFVDMCAQACCNALVPLLDELVLMQQNYLLITRKRLDDKQSGSQEGQEDEPNAVEINKFCVINPFKIGLRVEVNKDQVGYVIGMNGNVITQEVFLTSLDNELIQLLHHANNSNINILLEFTFYVQERFNCDNPFLYGSTE